MQKILLAMFVAVFAASASAQTGTVAFSSATYTANDTDVSATITVLFTGITNTPVTIDFNTSNGSAKAGVDYTATTGTLTFAAGVLTNTFDIPLLSSAGLPSNETVNVALSNPTGPVTLASPSNAVLTILSTAPSALQFSQPQFNVVRHVGTAVVTVLRTGDSSALETVNFATSDGTAQSGTDYLGTRGTLIFNPGDSSKSFSFKVLDPPAFESNKTVNVTLTDQSSVTLGTAVVLLVNDRPQTIAFTDTDGDGVAITLKFAGTMTTTQPLPPFDIMLSGTDSNSVLTVRIKKGKSGDGLIEVGAITGDGGCRMIDAPGVDLTGDGVQLGDFLGNLRVHDLLNGASVVAGGDTGRHTTITAHVIDDNTAVNVGSRLSLTAASFGAGTIDAPSARSISIRGDKKNTIAGDCAANITLTGDGVSSNQFTLGKLSVAGKLDTVTIEIDDGSVGSIGAGQIIDSLITVGYTATDPSAPLAGGDFLPSLALNAVNVRGVSDGFVDSFIVAAKIGAVHINSVTTGNLGVPFGILANESVGSVSVKTPSFKWQRKGATDQSLGDFHVIY